MHPRPFFLIAALFLAPLHAAASSDTRTWTDQHGREIQASLLEVHDGQVTILRDDGRRFTLPTATFSEEDRRFIREWQAQQPPPPAASTGDWPVRVQTPVPQVEIVLEQGRTNVYRTEHFEFRSDARLSRSLVRQFGHIFEATFAAVQALPLNLDIAAPPGEGLFVTRLFADPADYFRAGGIPGSGGLYNPRAREILIPIEHLGVRSSSSGFTFDRDADNSTLIHEITHQVMHPWIGVMPVWLTEGFATYMETIPYTRGVFQFRQQNLRQRFERIGQLEGTPVRIVQLEELMSLSYADWTGGFAVNRHGVARNYHTALLLTHFFLHLDGDGDARRLIRYLHALRSGVEENAAREFLLDGRSYAELEREMTTIFGRTGIRLASP